MNLCLRHRLKIIGWIAELRALALSRVSARRVFRVEPSNPSNFTLNLPAQHTQRTMDRQSVYTLSLFGENENVGGESNKKIQKELVDFVLEFHLENVYIYR